MVYGIDRLHNYAYVYKKIEYRKYLIVAECFGITSSSGYIYIIRIVTAITDVHWAMFRGGF
jgi:hypothetical protein